MNLIQNNGIEYIRDKIHNKSFRMINGSVRNISYTVLNILGSGSYGIVTLIKTNENELYALKTVKIAESLNNEIFIMSKLKCMNTVQLFGYSYEIIEPNQSSYVYYLLLEYSFAISLESYISKITVLHYSRLSHCFNKKRNLQRNNLLKCCRSKYIYRENRRIFTANSIMYNKENIFIHIAKELLKGVYYLHRKKICHGDMKPGNILISEDFKIKICDFGNSFQLMHSSSNLRINTCTPLYRAPENFLDDSKYTTKIDIWAIGVILIELITNIKLFYSLEKDIFARILEIIPSTPEICHKYNVVPNNSKFLIVFLQKYISNEDLIDLLTKMLTFDSKKRLSAKESLKHCFFKNKTSKLQY